VQAEPGTPGLPTSDRLHRLAIAFPVHEFDADGARADAARRLTALINLGAPEAILAGDRDAQPVRVTLADAPGARPLMAYFQPLQEWLHEQNRGRKVGWE
jgi:hypothetical protein